jgi:Ala-tRNA(Pro) deacylase
MSMPRWIAATLQDEHVPYHVRHHRSRYTAQEVAAEEHISGHRLAKVVVVKAGDEMAVIVLPASQRLDLEAVSQAMGGKECRLATEQEIAERFSDCEVGAIPPLRHWDGVQILADARLMEPKQEHLVFQAGTHEDAVEMAAGDWERIARPSIGRFAASLN